MESWTEVESITETVDRLAAVARQRGFSVYTYSRLENKVVVELLGPVHRDRDWIWGRIKVRRSRSGRIDVRNQSRGAASTISAVFVTVSVVLLLIALYYAIYASGMCAGDDYDLACDVARGITSGVSVIVAILGVGILLSLAWIWRPSRRRCFNALDSLIDEITPG